MTGSNTANILAKLFKNPTTTSPYDYNLSSTSPAIDKGVAITDVTTDINGYNRPLGNAFDVGSYEFIGSNIMPTPQNIRIIKN